MKKIFTFLMAIFAAVNLSAQISVEDGSLADWDNLPAEYVFTTTHTEGAYMDALKSVKVYATEDEINLWVEWDTDIITDLSVVPFHIYFNVDGDAETGGGWTADFFLEPNNTDFFLEGLFYADGAACAYEPGIWAYGGEYNTNEWDYSELNAAGTFAFSQHIGNNMMEIKLLYELIPANWTDEFSIGFDIQQSWEAVGVLPNAADAENGSMVLAEKLLVQIDHTAYAGYRTNIDGLWYEITDQEAHTVAVVRDPQTNYGESNYPGLTQANIPSSVAIKDISHSVTSIGNDAFSDCYNLTSVTIPNSITSIGSSAFYGCAGLREISLGSGLQNIGINAFAGCPRIYEVTCLAQEPPVAELSSFTNYDAYFHAPCDAQRYYSVDPIWKNFHNVECIVTENTMMDDITITPSDCEATVVWLSHEQAATYSLVIYKSGETYCTLTFNKYGQLINIALAPARVRAKQDAAAYTETGYSFTITGLEAGTTYDYAFAIFNDAHNTIDQHFGHFTTTQEVPTELSDIQTPTTNTQKIIRDGQIIILRDGVEYNALGQIINK